MNRLRTRDVGYWRGLRNVVRDDYPRVNAAAFAIFQLLSGQLAWQDTSRRNACRGDDVGNRSDDVTTCTDMDRSEVRGRINACGCGLHNSGDLNLRVCFPAPPPRIGAHRDSCLNL